MEVFFYIFFLLELKKSLSKPVYLKLLERDEIIVRILAVTEDRTALLLNIFINDSESSGTVETSSGFLQMTFFCRQCSCCTL